MEDPDPRRAAPLMSMQQQEESFTTEVVRSEVATCCLSRWCARLCGRDQTPVRRSLPSQTFSVVSHDTSIASLTASTALAATGASTPSSAQAPAGAPAAAATAVPAGPPLQPEEPKIDPRSVFLVGELVERFSETTKQWQDGVVTDVAMEDGFRRQNDRKFNVRRGLTLVASKGTSKWLPPNVAADPMKLRRSRFHWVSTSKGAKVPDHSLRATDGAQSSYVFVGRIMGDSPDVCGLRVDDERKIERIASSFSASPSEGDALVLSLGYQARWLKVKKGDDIPSEEALVKVDNFFVGRDKDQEPCPLVLDDAGKIKGLQRGKSKWSDSGEVLLIEQAACVVEVELRSGHEIKASASEYRPGDFVLAATRAVGITSASVGVFVECELSGLPPYRSSVRKTTDGGQIFFHDVPPSGSEVSNFADQSGEAFFLNLPSEERTLDQCTLTFRIKVRNRQMGDALLGTGHLRLADLQQSSDIPQGAEAPIRIFKGEGLVPTTPPLGHHNQVGSLVVRVKQRFGRLLVTETCPNPCGEGWPFSTIEVQDEEELKTLKRCADVLRNSHRAAILVFGTAHRLPEDDPAIEPLDDGLFFDLVPDIVRDKTAVATAEGTALWSELIRCSGAQGDKAIWTDDDVRELQRVLGPSASDEELEKLKGMCRGGLWMVSARGTVRNAATGIADVAPNTRYAPPNRASEAHVAAHWLATRNWAAAGTLLECVAKKSSDDDDSKSKSRSRNSNGGSQEQVGGDGGSITLRALRPHPMSFGKLIPRILVWEDI
mmetsp:Transcript_24753/g.53822  ORF Transcript_24753/g.53822 Transcript_24753/m.53822 type:complete len:773 (+) Transcript_24753:382-2700(+)